MEDSKLSSSSVIIGTDESCTIALELSENDPFFDKKKNLLHNKGFHIREHVQLKSLTCPDSIATTLEKMLQIARITHLDEIELYFGEIDECSSVEYCSPRNEVEALNSILALVNSMLSRKTRTEMNVLQALRDAIVDRFEEFVDKNREEARIDKSYICDKEKRVAEWGEINGIKSKLEIVYVEGAGRGAIATKDLKAGDVAMEIPVSIIISEELVHQSDMHLRIQYDELVPALCNKYPDVFPPELYTWEQFLWACELWYSNSMKVMFPDGKLRTCLIPFAGFLNHSLHPHIIHYGKVDSMTNTLKFPLSRPCLIGEQCCLSYGNFSSSHLITFYGFLPQGDNPYDVIPLDFDAGEPDSMEDCPVSSQTTHMVRGTWLSKNHNIFHYGLPSPLLNFLRSAQGLTLHNMTITRSNLEIEMQILEDLQSTFNNMMENLGDADLVDREVLCYSDRETAAWDVKLAIEFKDLQRRIVSSIVTSCDAGIKLVQHELSKWTAEE
ncbi:uncharacterized protein LOC110600553 isoform X5 [Manihot esculenta]|uniref:uncharacterized protein LOC110600553 isoform X5 n=1 Tax=Manihot esculenta TaxID=3983 RepID=UPI001CC4A49C|nr:uncharacterized protein LOC110600553 isoform X5 [Manihot esculenta]